MKTLIFSYIFIFLTALGCGTVGKNFDSSLADSIVNNKTTKQEITTMYGEPHRRGVENGNPIWIYEYSTYRLLGRNTSKDMIVVFDKNGIVQSHQYMSNNSSP